MPRRSSGASRGGSPGASHRNNMPARAPSPPPPPAPVMMQQPRQPGLMAQMAATGTKFNYNCSYY